MRTSRAVLAALLGLAAGAATAAPPPGKAVVTAYRPALGHSGADSMLDTPLHVDGVRVVSVKSAGRCVELVLDPGVRTFYSESVEDAFPLLLEPGGTYYLRIETHAGLTKAHGLVAPLDPQFGAQDYATKSTTSMKALRFKLKPQKPDRQPPPAPPGPAGDPAAAPGPAPDTAPVPPGKVLLVFYRPAGFAPGVNTSVFVDGRELADLDDRSYVAFAVEPGRHELRCDEPEDAFALELAAGDVRYVRVDTKAGVWKGHGEMVVFENAWGRRDFASHLAGGDGRPALRPARDVRAPELAVPIPAP